MFYFLHRLIKWMFIALVGAGLYWLWLQREVLEPVYVWYDVYDNGGLQKTERLRAVSGTAIHVIDGHTFQLSSGKQVYSVRLTGLEVPVPPLPENERQREVERRQFLKETVMNQPVDVQVTYSENGGLLGIVTAKGTNINLYYLTNGLGNFRHEYVKGLPPDVQYQFFAAKRLRETQIKRESALAMRSTP